MASDVRSRFFRVQGAVLAFLLVAVGAQAGPLDNVPLHDWAEDAFIKVIAAADYRYPTLSRPFTKGEMAEALIAIADDPAMRARVAETPRVDAVFTRLSTMLSREIEFYRAQKDNGEFDYHVEWVDRASVRAVGTDVDGHYDQLPRGECRDCAHARFEASHSVGIEQYAGLTVEEEAFTKVRNVERDWQNQIELVRGYAKVQYYNVEIEAGRDSLWWGSGYNGTLVLSDNAPPFDLAKIGAFRPFFFPWVFRHLGRFDWSFFITRLEKDRVVPHPWLTGMRATLSPTGYLDLGVTRIIMFGGEGTQAATFTEWLGFLVGEGEHNLGEGPDTNQLSNMEIRLSLAFLRRWVWMPFKELQVSYEYGAESSGNHWVRAVAPLWTAYVDFGPADLRLEWMDLNQSFNWYTHFTYANGYTYEGRVIGHNANSQSSRRFVQAAGYPAEWLYLRAWWRTRTAF